MQSLPEYASEMEGYFKIVDIGTENSTASVVLCFSVDASPVSGEG